MPLAFVLVVFAADLALGHVHSVLTTGLLDEPAHVATAAVVLLAVCGRSWLVRHPCEGLVVLVCAEAIDVDHLPLYLGVERIALGGRPFSHSLATVVVLVLVSGVLPVGRRRWPLAAACGVCLHFMRDLATGPGVLLFWPLSDHEVLLPYQLYAAVIIGLAPLGALRMAPGLSSDSLKGPRT